MADPSAVKRIFMQALDLPPTQRGAFLDRTCLGDAELRCEVESLLAAHESESTFLNAPIADPAAILHGAGSGAAEPVTLAAPLREGPGSSIGPYKLLELIGEGGFGSVFMAEQQTPVVRRVALKIIKLGMDTRQVIARFEAERQALAMMDHPNIAKILDAGTTETGRPYFVMELVKGVVITSYCDQNHLSTRLRLELLIPVCQAIQHAHQKGIIHRDIKPTNILITLHDGKPVPKVIDFGIAKATNQRLTEKTVFTQFHAMIGTPAYMSPEQAEMSGLDIDTRTDVYSLGVLLYELLTGTTPFDTKSLMQAGYAEMQRIIREVDPPKPSTRLSTMGDTLPSVAALRQTEPARLSKVMRGDLDWIVMRCLEKDRARRYETANGLVMDIQRYLADEPVSAGPPSGSYRLRKFVRRNRTWVSGVATIVAALVAGLGAATYGLVSARHERDAKAAALSRAVQAEGEERRQRKLAEQQRDKSERIASFLSETFKGVRKSVARNRDTAMLREMMDAAAKRITDGELKDAPEAELRLRLTMGDTYRQIAALDAAERMLGPAERLARRTFGRTHSQTAEAHTTAANLLYEIGKYDEALAKFQAALEIARALNKGDHRDVAMGLNDVAGCLDALGRSAEALPMYEEALAMCRRLCKGDHDDVVSCLENVGTCLVGLGRPDEALPKFNTALEMCKRLAKGDHPDVALALNNLGGCLNALSRSADALKEYQAALKMRQRLYKNEDHPDIAESLNNVAVTLMRLARPAEALPKYEASLAMCRRVFKGDHPTVATGLNNVAHCLGMLDRSADALPMLEEALAMWQRVVKGRDHPDVANCLNNLASCLDSLRRPADALPKHEAALEMLQRLNPGDHPDVAFNLHGLAQGLEELGRPADALPKYEAAVAMYQRLVKGDDEDLALSLNNLAHCLMRLGRPADALPNYEAALTMWQHVFKADHPYVESALFNVGDCLNALGRPADALPRYEAALAMHRRLLPPGHPDLAADLAKLARLQLTLGHAQAAETLLRECLAIRENAFPEGHEQAWLCPVTRSMLGEALADQGRFAEAEPLLLDGYNRLTRERPPASAPLQEARPFARGPVQVRGAQKTRDVETGEALRRIAKLYAAWHAAAPEKGYGGQAEQWRAKLRAWEASTRPSATQAAIAATSPASRSTSHAGE